MLKTKNLDSLINEIQSLNNQIAKVEAKVKKVHNMLS